MSGWLDGPVLNVLETGLNASNLRNQVLGNNLANIDTPNFKRSDVNFQTVLDAALGKTDGNLPLKRTLPQHIPGIVEAGESAIVTDQSTSLRNDGNNVDIDSEMSNVAENGIYYQALARTISSQLGLLRTVIK